MGGIFGVLGDTNTIDCTGAEFGFRLHVLPLSMRRRERLALNHRRPVRGPVADDETQAASDFLGNLVNSAHSAADNLGTHPISRGPRFDQTPSSAENSQVPAVRSGTHLIAAAVRLSRGPTRSRSLERLRPDACQATALIPRMIRAPDTTMVMNMSVMSLSSVDNPVGPAVSPEARPNP